MDGDESQADPVRAADGTPIPGGLRLLRIANRPRFENLSPEHLELAQNGRALPTLFSLSSEDKAQAVPRLSVWIEQLTTIAQSWHLTGANPHKTWVVFLATDEVRSVSAAAVAGLPATPALDVQWEQAKIVNEKGDEIPDPRPGAKGHAGIANLDRGNKTQKLALRNKLANIATVRILSEGEIAGFTLA